MSERVFYPDTNDVSSTSKVVALTIARNRTREMTFRFTLSCHAIAFRLAVASCEGWLASAEALYKRRFNREAKFAYFLVRNRYFLFRAFFGARFFEHNKRKGRRYSPEF
jgi:hypothetical protein